MSYGGHPTIRPYPAIILLELVLAVALPVAAVLIADLYWVPLAIFLMTSLPAGIALYVNGFLRVPLSTVLIGVLLYISGGLLSTVINTGLNSIEFVSLLWSSIFILYFSLLLSTLPLLTESDTKLILILIVIAGAVNAGINVLLFLGDDPRTTLPGDGRLWAAIGTPGGKSPTTVSVRCAVFFAAAFALATASRSSRPVKIVAAAAAIPIGGMLILTVGRGGYLGALAGMLSVVPFVGRRVRVLVLGGIGVAAVLSLYPPIFEAVIDRGTSYRTEIWITYLKWAWETPLIGQGMIANVHRVIGGAEFSHAHNLIISALTRGGPIGLAGMVIMLGAGLYWSWTYARRFGEPVFLAMMVALCVAGMFDYELLLKLTDWTWVTFWLPIGLAAGAEIALRREGASRGEATSRGCGGGGPGR